MPNFISLRWPAFDCFSDVANANMDPENAQAETVNDDVSVAQVPATKTVLGKHEPVNHFFHVEKLEHGGAGLVYANTEEEPDLHARTYIAVGAIFILYLVQVMALQGPPAVVSCTFAPLRTSSFPSKASNIL